MKKIVEYIKYELKNIYPLGEVISIIRLIISEVCGMSLEEQMLYSDKKLSENECKRITEFTKRLRKMEPLQYILEKTEFYSIPMYLNSNVLIPRPETEELVDMIIKSDSIQQKMTLKRRLKILDIGAGSGCISIALAKYIPNADVFAGDISEYALANIINNRNILHLFNIKPLYLNILNAAEQERTKTRFDIIVSNPPYVLNSEKKTMSDNVLKYEPKIALFVPGNDPLKFYRHIADFAVQKLIKNGFLYLEINPLYHIELDRLLQKKRLRTINVVEDLSGKKRFITAKK